MKRDDNLKDAGRKANTHTTREGWLQDATKALCPYFESLGYKLPENIRHAIAFTSGGKRGMEGECWHPESSADGHYEIFIRPDNDAPLDVLGILVHELIHTLLPLDAKHGKPFRDVALRIGLEGKMTHTKPTAPLLERLTVMADALGPLPHGALNFAGGADRPRKSGAKYLKAECGASCGYTIRLIAKWAKFGMPLCQVDPAHGPLHCEIPEEG